MRYAACYGRVLLAFTLLVSFPLPASADSVFEQAKQLLEKKEAKAAYALLEPLEIQRAGDPEYDYLFGIAAIDSGNPSRAVFALERVLAVQPDNALARAEIARAYFMLGELKTAKQQFETVQKEGVPTEARATIQKYLSAIEEAVTGRPKVTGFIEFGLGTDSNVNSATAAGQVAVPAFGGAVFTLNQAGVKARDDFASLAGGINLRYPLKPGLALVAGANASQKSNSSQTQFDTSDLNGNLGLNFIQGKNSYTIALQGDQFYVDYGRFRDAWGAVGQWLHTIDDNNSVSAYLQWTRLEYPGQDIRNADRQVVGAAYGHAFGGKYAPVVYAGAYFGREDERAAGVPHLGHELKGLRLGGQLALTEKTVLFAAASVEQRDYGGPDPLFLKTRDDTQKDLRLGITYRPVQLWSVTPQVSYTDNSSNIIINDFDRTVVSVTVRRDFN